jgi:hypothetical protein
MAHRFALSRIPVCQSPTAAPPENKALLIGINYASPPGDNEQGYRELKGPVNDAKEMKKALIGAVVSLALELLGLTRLSTELFDYKEEDICLMTDEEVHKNTALWPTKDNIVRVIFPRTCTLIPTDPDARTARSRARRLSRRCVRLLL